MRDANSLQRFSGRMLEAMEPRQLLANISVTDLSVTVPSYSSYEHAELNGVAYFEGEVLGTTDNELWRSDGTPAGTYRVKELANNPYGATILYLTNCGGTLYFTTSDSGGDTLWRSDGTDAGTYAVKSFPGGEVADITNVNGTVFFDAYSTGDPDGRELWKSDGTSAGTVRVADISPGPANTVFLTMFGWNGKLFFGADDGTQDQGIELYVSDGTSAGTFELKDIYPGSSNGYPIDFIPFNNKLYFSANDAAHGDELWETDGTTAGTKLVKDIIPGPTGSFPVPTIVLGNSLYVFTQPTLGLGQMWKFDTNDNATLVKQFASNSSSPYASGAVSFVEPVGSNQMFFSAADDTHSIEPWVSDGTTAGTHMIKEIMPGGGVSGAGIEGTTVAEMNGVALFPGIDPTHGEELWQTDGTAAGTTLVDDLAPGQTSSQPQHFFTAGSNIFFSANVEQTPFGTLRLFAATVTASPVAGSISGTVFNDANGNSVLDNSETGIANITVYNDVNNNGKMDAGELSTSTDASGNYVLSGLPAGNYKIRQILPTGWKQTTPSNNYGWTLTLAANQALSGKNIGEEQIASPPPPPTGGSIAGMVFNDLNGSGTLNSGESGLSGITVYNDANNNGKLDTGEVTTITDADGNYMLSSLAAGSYKIREIVPSGWKQTTPTNNYGWTITLVANQSLTGKNFGEQVSSAPPPPPGASISGTVFNDTNGDQKQDDGEIGFSGWTVYIDTNNDGDLDNGEVSTLTNAEGGYTFSNLAAGNYIVRVIHPGRWSQTTPTMNYGQHVTIVKNQNLTNVAFGEKAIG